MDVRTIISNVFSEQDGTVASPFICDFEDTTQYYGCGTQHIILHSIMCMVHNILYYTSKVCVFDFQNHTHTHTR